MEISFLGKRLLQLLLRECFPRGKSVVFHAMHAAVVSCQALEEFSKKKLRYFDPEKNEMYKKIREFNDVLIKKALELNGTITGEHGVGLHKKEYLLAEHPDNIPLMKIIKRSIDQNNIMNPGKIFDLN